MASTLTILGTPTLAAALLLLDAVSPVASHLALGVLAVAVLAGGVLLLKREMKRS